MALNLTNLRVFPEDERDKQSLLLPTNMQPLTRSLVTERPASSEMFDTGFGPQAPVFRSETRPKFVYTVEVPFRSGQANTIPLPLGVTVWLDDPAMNRKFKGRRAVSIINEDALIGLRWSFDSGAASGALMAPSGSISFPADEHIQLYAFTLNPAGGNISLVQFA
jgi:hypothetical protein